MRVDVAQYVKNIRANRKLRHRIAAFLTAMSMAVSMTVFWQLRGVGTAMEEDIRTCSQQEHSHTDNSGTEEEVEHVLFADHALEPRH